MSGQTLVIERPFQAPAQAVFDAWTGGQPGRAIQRAGIQEMPLQPFRHRAADGALPRAAGPIDGEHGNVLASRHREGGGGLCKVNGAAPGASAAQR